MPHCIEVNAEHFGGTLDGLVAFSVCDQRIEEIAAIEMVVAFEPTKRVVDVMVEFLVVARIQQDGVNTQALELVHRVRMVVRDCEPKRILCFVVAARKMDEEVGFQAHAEIPSNPRIGRTKLFKKATARGIKLPCFAFFELHNEQTRFEHFETVFEPCRLARFVEGMVA